MSNIMDSIGDAVIDDGLEILTPVHDELKNMSTGEFALLTIILLIIIVTAIWALTRSPHPPAHHCEHRCVSHTTA